MQFATQALHAGQEPDPTTLSRGVPIYPTTSYVFKDTEHAANLFALKEFGNIYSRLMNPTNDVLEKRLAALDGGAAGLAFASGQAAITASILTICHAGQNFISATSLYGGTWTLFTQTLSKLGIEVRFFDPNKPEEINKLVDDKTRCVYLESIGNPKNDVPDFRKIADIAHKHGLPTIIDNTVMTPARTARTSTSPAWYVLETSASWMTGFTLEPARHAAAERAGRLGVVLGGRLRRAGDDFVAFLQALDDFGVDAVGDAGLRSEEHTSELQSPCNLVCRLLLEKKNPVT